MARWKVEICLKKKKPTLSTNIPLLSYRKSEQQTLSRSIILLVERFKEVSQKFFSVTFEITKLKDILLKLHFIECSLILLVLKVKSINTLVKKENTEILRVHKQSFDNTNVTITY